MGQLVHLSDFRTPIIHKLEMDLFMAIKAMMHANEITLVAQWLASIGMDDMAFKLNAACSSIRGVAQQIGNKQP